MVNSVHTRTVVAYRTQAARVQELAQTALIEDSDRGYTYNAGASFRATGDRRWGATMNINSVGTTAPTVPSAANPTVANDSNSSASKGVANISTAQTESVQFSPEVIAAAEAAASEAPSLRAERLAQIKAEIDAGTYDTDAKFDAAVERMLDKLA